MSRKTQVSPEQLHSLPPELVDNERSLDDTSTVGLARLLWSILKDEVLEFISPGPIDECNRDIVQRIRH